MSCLIPGTALGSLQVGFYSKTCPNAEFIVRSFVQAATRKNPATPAQLLRLHYHDCFVQGCDGSILHNGLSIANAESIVHSFVQAATTKNPATSAQLLDCFVQCNAESIVRSFVQAATRKNPAAPTQLLDCFVQGCDGSILIQKPIRGVPARSSNNHAGVDGDKVIDDAKTDLERQCQGIVSCADIVALAARDAVALSQGPVYQVPTGRRDGRVSNINDADDMPIVSDSVEVLKAKFADKGLSENDLVLLTGAHTIGTADCFFIRDRLYNFSRGGGHDPLMNPKFLPELQSMCPIDNSPGIRLPLDHGSERKFDTKIMENIKTGFGVIASDAILYTDSSMKKVIDSYVGPTHSRSRHNFGSDFVKSTIRMGQIGVLTGKDGEVRRVCSEFN